MLFLEKKIQKKNANQPTLKNIEMFPETRHFLALYELYLLFNPYFVFLQVLMDMFSQEEADVSLPPIDEPIRRESLSYEDIVKDFILEENQYLHDLNMIIKVFRAPFYQHFPRSKVGRAFAN